MFESFKAKKLVSALEDDPPEEVVEQFRALRGPGVDALVSGLRSSSDTVRRGAARVLGELAPARAIRPLAAAGTSEAAAALQAIAARTARPRVLRALKGGEEPAAALAALLTASYDALRGEAEAALIQAGSRAAAVLTAAFETEELSDAAARVLRQMGADGAAILVALLRHRRSPVRRQAAGALDASGWKPADRIEEAVLAAARQDWQRCGELGAPAVEPLIALLADAESEVRLRAARLLGALKDPRAVPPLASALADRKDAVQLAAIGALGELGDPRAVEPLAALLRSRYDLRAPVLKALQQIGWQPESTADRVLLAVMSDLPLDAAAQQFLIETSCTQDFSSVPEDVVVRGLARLGDAEPELLRVLKRGGQAAAVARDILNQRRPPEEHYVLCPGCFLFLGMRKELRQASRCTQCGARIVV